MVDFSKYKANRESNKEKLTELLKTQEAQAKKTYSNEDDRFWKPAMDSVKKVGGAVIRFLPEANEDNLLNYVKYYEHSFKNPDNGKYYIERSLTSLNPPQQDAIAIFNKKLWGASSDKQDPLKKIASSQKRNTKYVANILVINDPAVPENNGKVFLYRFGPAIYNKLDASINPKEDSITKVTPDSIDPFDIIDGANLEIRIKDTENGWNYDDSKFSAPSPMAKSDAVFDAVLKQVYDLTEFVAESNYKTVESLDKRLIEVLGHTYKGFEVVEGYEPVKKQQQYQQAEAPVKKEVENNINLSDSVSTKSEVSLQTQEDEDFFNDLMKQEI